MTTPVEAVLDELSRLHGTIARLSSEHGEALTRPTERDYAQVVQAQLESALARGDALVAQLRAFHLPEEVPATSQPAPHMHDPQCHRMYGHHSCALIRVNRLQDQVEVLAQQLTAARKDGARLDQLQELAAGEPVEIDSYLFEPGDEPRVFLTSTLGSRLGGGANLREALDNVPL